MTEETIREKVFVIYQEVAREFLESHETIISKEVIRRCKELDDKASVEHVDSFKGSYRERLANFFTEEEAKKELKDRIMHIPDSRERNRAIKANADLFMYGGK